MQNNFVTIKDVSFAYTEPHKKSVHVMDRISFDVKQGEFVCIVGPSGCGKSTLLRMILGLLPIQSGSVASQAQNGSFVFQNFALFPWLTVSDNVGFGLKMKGVSLQERRKIIHEKLSEVGLAEMAHRYPKELSGGQKQRVGIARALAVNPDILFLDEPFSSLDSITAGTLKRDIMELWKKYGMTVVMVTHLIPEAIELADSIVILSQKPSHVKRILKVSIPRPRNNRSEEFFSLVDSVTDDIDM